MQPGGLRFIATKLVHNGGVDYDLILSTGTQISQLKRDWGEMELSRVLAQIITAFQKSFNIYAPMDDEQIADTAIDMIADYWAYRLEDFVAFFQAARKGYYGEIKNRLDEQTILTMLAKYDRERMRHLEEKQLAPKSMELTTGTPKAPDAIGRKLDGMAGALAELKGQAVKDAKAIDAYQKKYHITDPTQTVKPRSSGKK